MKTTRQPAYAGHHYWKGCLLACVLLIPGVALAVASTGVSYTLEGCRNNGAIVLPNGSGDFICPNAAYTTGNLGKGWNELDLVPHRATLTAGNSAPPTQTYMFSFAADNCNTSLGTSSTCADGSTEGVQGYDYISFPVLNTALSSASCTAPVSVSDPLGVMKPGIGGETVSVFRDVTVTQLTNTKCVYDYYERLALGSHLYNGSSLHSYLVNPSGDKTVPLPVKDILAQALRKDMSAVANASVAWDVTKNSDSSVANFGDVCSPDLPGSVPATVHVVWTKVSTTSTGVVATAHVYANNPSSRPITVDVDDVIYKGIDQSTPLHTTDVTGVVVPAHTESLVLTDVVNLPAGSGGVGDSINDVATASYTDTVTGFPIPGNTTAEATATIGTGTVADLTANVTDTESISGNGLTFSVPSPSVGGFTNYVAGTHTVGPVDWAALLVTDSGSVTFNKSIYLAGPIVTSGVLTDTAELDTADQSVTSNPVNIDISSTATVQLTVSKTIPADYLSLPGDTLDVAVHVAGAAGYTNDLTFHFVYGGQTTLSTQLGGLEPDMFTVTEGAMEFCDTADGCTALTLLAPVVNPIMVDLSVPAGGNMTGRCTGTADLVNQFAPQGIRVQAQKITTPALLAADPDYSWTINLSGPTACDALVVGAGAGFLTFQHNGTDCLLGEGHYIVNEVNKAGWIAGDPACEFDVDKVFNDGQTYSCTFHNRRLARASLLKTKSGVADTSPTDLVRVPAASRR